MLKFDHPIELDGEASIIKTANPENVIAELTVHNASGYGGIGYDYYTGLRNQEPYVKPGKEPGMMIARKFSHGIPSSQKEGPR